MAEKYCARFASPNIVIVPSETTNKNLPGKTNITENSGPSTIKQLDTKYSNVLSKTFNKSLVNKSLDLKMSTNCGDIDSVEEALRQLHNVQTVLPAVHIPNLEIKSSNSKYSSQSNLIQLINTSNKNNDSTLKSVNSLQKQEIGTKVPEPINIKLNKKHVQDSNNSAKIEQSVSTHRLQNKLDCSTSSNNYKRSITSFKTENKLKHMNTQDLNSVSLNETKTKDSVCDSSSKIFREQKNCDDKNVSKTCSKQRKVLETKANSSRDELGKKHFEPSSKGKLAKTLKEQKRECENLKSNNGGLRSERLSREHINVKTSGALKRYLDYQRFLEKYHMKPLNKSCLREPKLREKRPSKCLKDIKEKKSLSYVKPITERNEKKESLKLKSVIESAKRKQKTEKLDSHSDKKSCHKEATIDEHKKRKGTSYDITSTEKVNKKDEMKIKVMSCLASKKRKEKPFEKPAKQAKTIETNKKLTSLNKTEKTRDRKDVSSKHKLQKKEPSEKIKLKKETIKKANQSEISGLKRKSDLEHEETKKNRKSESSTERNSSSREIKKMTPKTSTRTVEIIKKSSAIDNGDLRSKLSRKRIINHCNKDITRIKSSSKLENLLVTLKQEAQANKSNRLQAVSKPKVKKSKKIKLVINIKCSSSNDDSDEVANEIEPEIGSGNTSPHQDLSFLDDIDIDGIVDSLNAGQNMRSPIRENNISTETDLKDELIRKNSSKSSEECSKIDSYLIEIQDLQIRKEQSKVGFIHQITNPQATATNNETNLLTEHNDDVYEVIDITDDVGNNIILVDDDSVLVSTDQTENVEQSLVAHTKYGNKSDILLNEPNNNSEEPIIHINNNSRDEIDVINIADAEIETEHIIHINNNSRDEIDVINIADAEIKTEQLDVKFSDAKVNKNADQETSNNLSNKEQETKNLKKENEIINMKYECEEAFENVVASDLISSGADHPNTKKGSHDASVNPLLNIKKETYDKNTVDSKSVKKEAHNEAIHLSTCVKKEPHNVSIRSTKIIMSENVSITPEQINIDSKDNDKIPVREISVRNATIIKSENTNCASSDYNGNPKKDTVAVNQSKCTPPIEKVNTELSKNRAKQTETMTSKIKNQPDNPETVTGSPIKNQPIPEQSEQKGVIDIKNPTTTSKPNLKIVESYEAPLMNTEHRSGNLNKKYINTMEKHMFDKLNKKFTVLNFIHDGYFAKIYKCQDSNGRIYAVKALRTRFLSIGIYKQKIFSGLQKVENKNGYNILEIIDHFHIGSELCFLSEYYPRNLDEELINKKFLHIDMVQNLSRQLVSAVIMLKRNNIIHSDIKPGHILLNSEGNRLRLSGFDRADYDYNINITPSSGTTNYRAPEIILGFYTDFKIDVWATALVMYEMAWGTTLFPGRFNNQVLYNQICTLGRISKEMLENGIHVHKHFLDTNFKFQVGRKEFVYVTEFPVKRHKLCTFSFGTGLHPTRTMGLITETPNKYVMLQKLLKQMLITHPRYRLQITEVLYKEFFL